MAAVQPHTLALHRAILVLAGRPDGLTNACREPGLVDWKPKAVNLALGKLRKEGMLFATSTKRPVWFTTRAAAERASANVVLGLASAAAKDFVLEAAAQPGGFATAMLPSEHPQRLSSLIQRLVRAGQLHRGSTSHKTVRWFTTRAAADAFEGVTTTQSRPQSVTLSATAEVVWPTNPDGSPAWKYTVGPAYEPSWPSATPARPSAQPGQGFRGSF